MTHHTTAERTTGQEDQTSCPVFFEPFQTYGAPAKEVLSFCGERRNSGMSELCRLRRGEGYGACSDVGHGVGQKFLSQLFAKKNARFHLESGAFETTTQI